jgi:hypothetical protein
LFYGEVGHGEWIESKVLRTSNGGSSTSDNEKLALVICDREPHTASGAWRYVGVSGTSQIGGRGEGTGSQPQPPNATPENGEVPERTLADNSQEASLPESEPAESGEKTADWSFHNSDSSRTHSPPASATSPESRKRKKAGLRKKIRALQN